MIEIHRKIIEFIDKGCSFALATILRADGSTPRKAAVKAIIGSDGKIHGTLGGGRPEAEAQQRAVVACRSKRPILFDFQMNGPCAVEDEPICGGSVRILLDPTVDKNRAVFDEVLDALGQRKSGVLVTRINSAADTEVTMQWISEDKLSSEVNLPDIDVFRESLSEEKPRLFNEGSTAQCTAVEVFVEPVIPKPRLLIAGAGHIGRALSYQGTLIGYEVTIIDDRDEFANASHFPKGVEVICGDIPEQLRASGIDKDTYIVIVTRGHKLDAKALEACIKSRPAYIGMIGSRRKVALIRESFIGSGFSTEKEFDRVSAPIGLDIGADTVQEIATSIAAELIAVRRKGKCNKVQP